MVWCVWRIVLLFKIFQFVNETLTHTNWEHRYFIWRQHQWMGDFQRFTLCLIRNIIKNNKSSITWCSAQLATCISIKLFFCNLIQSPWFNLNYFFVFFPISRRSKNFSDDRKSGIQVSVWIWQWKFRRPGYVPSILSGELFFSSLVSKTIKCFRAHFHLWEASNGFFSLWFDLTLCIPTTKDNPIALRQT